MISVSNPGPSLQPSDVFEQPLSLGSKKIEFHIPLETPVIPTEDKTADEKTCECIFIFTNLCCGTMSSIFLY